MDGRIKLETLRDWIKYVFLIPLFVVVGFVLSLTASEKVRNFQKACFFGAWSVLVFMAFQAHRPWIDAPVEGHVDRFVFAKCDWLTGCHELVDITAPGRIAAAIRERDFGSFVAWAGGKFSACGWLWLTPLICMSLDGIGCLAGWWGGSEVEQPSGRDRKEEGSVSIPVPPQPLPVLLEKPYPIASASSLTEEAIVGRRAGPQTSPLVAPVPQPSMPALRSNPPVQSELKVPVQKPSGQPARVDAPVITKVAVASPAPIRPPPVKPIPREQRPVANQPTAAEIEAAARDLANRFKRPGPSQIGGRPGGQKSSTRPPEKKK